MAKRINVRTLRRNLSRIYLNTARTKAWKVAYWLNDYLLPFILKILLPWGTFFVFFCLYAKDIFNPEISSRIFDYDMVTIILTVIISFLSITIASRSEFVVGHTYNEIRVLDRKINFRIWQMIVLIAFLIILSIPFIITESALMRLVLSCIFVYYAVYILYEEIPYFEGGDYLEYYIARRLEFYQRREFRTGKRTKYSIAKVEDYFIDYLHNQSSVSFESTEMPIKKRKYSHRFRRHELTNYLAVRKELENRISDIDEIQKNQNQNDDDKTIQKIKGLASAIKEIYSSIPKYICNFELITDTCYTFGEFLGKAKNYADCENNNQTLQAINKAIDDIIDEAINEINDIEINIDFFTQKPKGDEAFRLHYNIALINQLLLQTVQYGNEWFAKKISSYFLEDKMFQDGSFKPMFYFSFSMVALLNFIISPSNIDYFCYKAEEDAKQILNDNITAIVKDIDLNEHINDGLNNADAYAFYLIMIYNNIFSSGIVACTYHNYSGVKHENIVQSLQKEWAKRSVESVQNYKKAHPDLLEEKSPKREATYLALVEEGIKEANIE